MRELNKSEWLPGPWMTEPDRIEFEHAGLPCLIIRGPVGSFCGYVAVGPEHPCHDKDYDDVNVDVHGGLTYANWANEHIRSSSKPEGELDDYWFGFDCAHYMDYTPGCAYLFGDLPTKDSVYRDIGYVTKEVESLAEQLANYGKD